MFLKLLIVPFVLTVAVATVFSPVSAAQMEKKPAIQSQSSSPASVFLLPRLFDQPENIFINLQNGRYKQSRAALNLMIRWFPFVPLLKYDTKGDTARRNYSKKVLEKLSGAFESNFRQVKKIPQKTYLKARKRYAEFAPLLKKAIAALSQKPQGRRGKPSPRKISNFKAIVDDKNTGWDPRLNVLKILFRFDPEKSDLGRPIGGKSPAAALVNDWYEQGLAAGNYGDLYDNRDDGHSWLKAKLFPQLSATVYEQAARAAGMHYGLNTRGFFNAITIGNSSTAKGGGLWRSLTRIALTTPRSPKLLYLQYTNNQLYFYPEHRDHDPEKGDVMPANTPYIITSQGSSGSDQPFLRTTATILAAFKPKVKQALKKAGLVMPTVQMILRRGQKGIDNDQDYLNGKAHPSVFRSEKIDVLKMVKLANELDIKDVPPMVGLKVVEESGIEKGFDPVPANLSDRLFDTPGAIARVVRSTAFEKRMLVQAGVKAMAKSQKLSFRWVVLRGDADRIKLIPKNASGSLMEIIVPWHERSKVPGRPELTSDRVDIGVFVDNGKHLSAPAFISLMYPGNQKRTYNTDKKIMSVDYQSPDYAKRYTDPLLFPARAWLDTYTYDEQGRLTGWQRRTKNKITDYTRDGAIVVERDDYNRAIKAQKVEYRARPASGARHEIFVNRLPGFLYYKYANSEDRFGTLVAK
jgi:YD repeat-containing protein